LLVTLARQADWRRTVIDSRWRRLVKAGASRGFFEINASWTLKTMTKKLKVKDEKLRRLHVLGRWRVLCTGLLQKYPDEPERRQD